ncbi:SDR family oxidoreductase [Kribbella turkmenica]|uniref:SDR family oxidoreductase n=1 Tax=Kribbella turkmenica TaxID=2530375 RepID=A0A4R4X0M6_9ACTN|nr:SDR family NAD(P)-dependent oxidoreductase [Kribbella turkmenica]TDD23729.1 SDR family oxidoreductase [Kribbella turkmenica]
MSSLAGRVVLVTGAGGGIGSAVARTVVAQGGHVLIHDLADSALEPLAQELGDSATTFVADLTDLAAVKRLWDEAWAAKGQVDVLVNNAGAYPPAPLGAPLDEWLAVWDFSLDLHLKAPAVLCREAVSAYSARADGGIIINLASRAAFRGEDPEYWHYAAAKAGVVAMTRTIARQYGRQGVTAFAIAPGYVDTNLNRHFRDTVGVAVAAQQTGLGEVAQPQDVANIIAFLASGQARHATGTTIDVNGASYVR